MDKRVKKQKSSRKLKSKSTPRKRVVKAKAETPKSRKAGCKLPTADKKRLLKRSVSSRSSSTVGSSAKKKKKALGEMKSSAEFSQMRRLRQRIAQLTSQLEASATSSNQQLEAQLLLVDSRKGAVKDLESEEATASPEPSASASASVTVEVQSENEDEKESKQSEDTALSDAILGIISDTATHRKDDSQAEGGILASVATSTLDTETATIVRKADICTLKGVKKKKKKKKGKKKGKVGGCVALESMLGKRKAAGKPQQVETGDLEDCSTLVTDAKTVTVPMAEETIAKKKNSDERTADKKAAISALLKKKSSRSVKKKKEDCSLQALLAKCKMAEKKRSALVLLDYDLSLSDEVKKSSGETETEEGLEESKEDILQVEVANTNTTSEPVSVTTSEVFEAEKQRRDSLGLTEEKHAAVKKLMFSKYDKMKKVGLPHAAVRDKMKRDGLSAEKIAEYFGEPLPATAKKCVPVDLSKHDLNKYKKMKKVGLPPAAVRSKMKKDGVDKRVIAAYFGEPDPEAESYLKTGSGSEEEEEEECEMRAPEGAVPDMAKYSKMQKFGLPPAAVKQKMKKDGIHIFYICKFFGEPLPKVKTETGPKPPPGPKPVLEKYAKMGKFGLPPAAVKQKMKKDGIDEYWICEFFGEPLPGTKKKKKAKRKGPTHAVKPFHWHTKSDCDWSHTIWSAVRVKDCNAFFEKDFETKLLSAFKVEAKKKKGKGKQKEDSAAVSLLDGKRSFNISVGISRLELTDFELRDALLSMDAAHVCVDLIQKISPFMPSNDELATVRAFHGDVSKLGRAERLFSTLSCMSEIPMRLHLWEFKLTFRETERELEHKIKCVRIALNATMKSKPLLAFMHLCLTAGNWMNDGTRRGSAKGLRLDSLDRFHSMRGGGDFKKWTLLMFLVDYCRAEAHKCEFEGFPSDLLVLLEAAIHFEPKDVRETVTDMEHSLEAIGKKIHRTKRKIAEARKGFEHRASSVFRVFGTIKRATSTWHALNESSGHLCLSEDDFNDAEMKEASVGKPQTPRAKDSILMKLRRYRRKKKRMQTRMRAASVDSFTSEGTSVKHFSADTDEVALRSPPPMTAARTLPTESESPAICGLLKQSSCDFLPHELDLSEDDSAADFPMLAPIISQMPVGCSAAQSSISSDSSSGIEELNPLWSLQTPAAVVSKTTECVRSESCDVVRMQREKKKKKKKQLAEQKLEESSELPPDRFEIVMTGFHRRSELRVEHMKAEFKGLKKDASKAAVYFGEDEDVEWNALFKMLNAFLLLFRKAEDGLVQLRKDEAKALKRSKSKARKKKRSAVRPKAAETEPENILTQIKALKKAE